MSNSCPFCTKEVNNHREILRTDLVWAFPTHTPIVPGHTLIVPVRCVATFEELTEEERKAIFDAMIKVKHALKKSFGAEGFNHAWNENKVGGQSVAHFHLHVLPRTSEDEVKYSYEPREFLYRSTSKRDILPEQELKEVAELIKENLAL